MPKKKPTKIVGSTSGACNPASNASNSASARSRPAEAMPAYFMSVEAAAARLAVSTKTVRRAIKDGRLVPTRLGRRVLISQGALQQFITVLISARWLPPAPKKP